MGQAGVCAVRVGFWPRDVKETGHVDRPQTGQATDATSVVMDYHVSKGMDRVRLERGVNSCLRGNGVYLVLTRGPAAEGPTTS
jgi:hypothetical protein